MSLAACGASNVPVVETVTIKVELTTDNNLEDVLSGLMLLGIVFLLVALFVYNAIYKS